MGKYIDGSGLSHFMGILKGAFAAKSDAVSNITRSGTTFTATKADGTSFTFTQQDNTVAKTSTTPKMNGTAAVGTETAYAAGDHVHPSDTSRVPTTRTINGKALSSNVTLYAGDIKKSSSENASVLEMFEDLNRNTYENLLATHMDGISLLGVDDGSNTHYATCSTAAATADKVVTISMNSGDYSLYAGSTVYVKFTVTNTAAVANLTLNVNSTGAKAIKYRGANLPSAATLSANRVYMFVYDGTNYELVGDLDAGEVNQNAFSNVKVGTTTVAADAKTDTLELAGSNVTLTPDATNDKVTIGITATNVTTALGNTAVARATGDASGNSISGTYAPKASPALTGTPTAPTAAAGTSTTQIATTAFVANAVGTATAGALQYKGTATKESDISDQAYKKGWYYVVSTAGTYFGKVCEVGDMLIAKQDKTSTPANDWDAIQSNIEVLSNSEIDTLWAAA